MLTRGKVVLTALLGAVLLLASSAMTWVTVSGLGETAAVPEVQVSGAEAADIVAAMGLVGMPAAAAVAISLLVGRRIIAVVMLAASAMALYTIVGTLVDPAGAVESAVGQVTGTTSAAQSYEFGAGPWIAAVGATLMLASGVVLLAVSHRWTDRKSSKKYSRHSAEADAEPDEYDLWDGLSEGDDPTDKR